MTLESGSFEPEVPYLPAHRLQQMGIDCIRTEHIVIWHTKQQISQAYSVFMVVVLFPLILWPYGRLFSTYCTVVYCKKDTTFKAESSSRMWRDNEGRVHTRRVTVKLMGISRYQ
jgi:hypothetical protein